MSIKDDQKILLALKAKDDAAGINDDKPSEEDSIVIRKPETDIDLPRLDPEEVQKLYKRLLKNPKDLDANETAEMLAAAIVREDNDRQKAAKQALEYFFGIIKEGTSIKHADFLRQVSYQFKFKTEELKLKNLEKAVTKKMGSLSKEHFSINKLLFGPADNNQEVIDAVIASNFPEEIERNVKSTLFSDEPRIREKVSRILRVDIFRQQIILKILKGIMKLGINVDRKLIEKVISNILKNENKKLLKEAKEEAKELSSKGEL